jgi:putative heme transporter
MERGRGIPVDDAETGKSTDAPDAGVEPARLGPDPGVEPARLGPDPDIEGAPTHGEVPRAVRIAADWSWRLLLIGAAVMAVAIVVQRLRLVFLAVFIGMLFAALLAPAVRRIQRVVRSRGAATAIVVVLALAVVLGLFALITLGIGTSLPNLTNRFTEGLEQIRDWLKNTFHIDDSTFQQYIQRFTDYVKSNRQGLLSGAISGARAAVEIITGAGIALFATVFFLLDGDRIWGWTVSLFPQRSQPDLKTVGARCWLVLTAYVRGTVFIASTDAVFVGLAMTIIGVPLALPLAVLVFFGAFVPIVGAFVTGFVAVVVALATKGPLAAVLVLAAIIAIQQIEGHLLQPLVMGRLVSLHPLGVIVAVAAGSVLAGLIGALVAVPVAAVLTTVIGYYGRRSRAGSLAPP